MEQYFYIDPTEDWLNCRTIPNDVGTKHNSFDLYIETNITFYDNSAYNFGNLKLVSDPIKVKISSNT
jgi:hypothetical protein